MEIDVEESKVKENIMTPVVKSEIRAKVQDEMSIQKKLITIEKLSM